MSFNLRGSTNQTNSSFGQSNISFGTTNQANTFGQPNQTPSFGTSTSNLFDNKNQTSGFGTSLQDPMQSSTSYYLKYGNLESSSNLGTGNLNTGFGTTTNQTTTLNPTFGSGSTFSTDSTLNNNSTLGTGLSLGSSTLGTGTNFSLGSGTLFTQKLQKPQQTSSFLFNNTNKPANLMLGQQMTQVQQQIQSQTNEIDPNTFNPKLFNDEHDRILGEFNKLQASWGFGKGYYAYNKAPTEFNQFQSFHKFKSIGFSEIKQASDEDENRFGILVKMENESQLNTAILQYEANLKSMFGMIFNVKVENSKQLPENQALLCISVVDNNTNKKVPAFQLVSFLNQTHIRQQLNNVFLNNFIQIVPLQPPSKQEIEEYLKVPPYEIELALWEQAKKENPDPKKFIPVPFIGFAALNSRFKFQVQECEQQKIRLQIISEDINNLERDVTQMHAKLEECKRRNVTLGNRVLKTMVWQEIRRKRGFPILAEEDELRVKLESIQNELNAPTKYKGCLNELICKLRHMQSQKQVIPNFTIEDSLMKELQAHLIQEQQGIQHLITLVKNDYKDLKALKGNFK